MGLLLAFEFGDGACLPHADAWGYFWRLSLVMIMVVCACVPHADAWGYFWRLSLVMIMVDAGSGSWDADACDHTLTRVVNTDRERCAVTPRVSVGTRRGRYPSPHPYGVSTPLRV